MPTVSARIIIDFIAFSVVLMGSLWFLNRAEGGYDLWWQLASGLRMLSEGRVVLANEYSFAGVRALWVNHEWGAEILFAAVFNYLGLNGLALLRALAVLIFLVCQYCMLRMRTTTPLSTVVLQLVIAGPLLAASANIRPQTFALVLFCLALGLVDYRKRRAQYSGVIFPGAALLCVILWVNMHGSVLLGVATLSWGLLLTETRPRALAGILIFFITLLAQPFGVEYFVYLLEELGSTHTSIPEWYPLRGVQWMVWGLLAFPIAWRIKDRSFFSDPVVAPTLAVAVLALFHARFLPFLMCGAVLLWAPYVERYFILFSKKTRSFITGGVCCVAVLCNLNALVQITLHGFSFSTAGQTLPIAALEFLQREKVAKDSTIALPLEWGGYALYTLPLNYKVSIDGRNVTAYTAQYVEEYTRAWVQGDLTKVLTLAPAHFLLCKPDSKIAAEARKDTRFTQRFSDNESVLFMR